jgi:hypothetical protein
MVEIHENSKAEILPEYMRMTIQMKIGLILFMFLSINVYSQDVINLPEVDNVALIKEKNNLAKAKVKQRNSFWQKGDTLGNFKDSYQSVMNISKNGRKIKERNYVILTENSITTIYKKIKLKQFPRNWIVMIVQLVKKLSTGMILN